jgi:hypothetical protein
MLVELSGADQCCGFGGTFAIKNADTSTAMLADKMRNVLGTAGELCTAGDSSCLMHIGGGLSLLRAGARTIHLAEILAATRDQPTALDRAERQSRDTRRIRGGAMSSPVMLGMPAIPLTRRAAWGNLWGREKFPVAGRRTLAGPAPAQSR